MTAARPFIVLAAAACAAACDGRPTSPANARATASTPTFDATGQGVVASATGSAHRIRGDELWVLSFSAEQRADGTTTGNARIDRKDLGISWNIDVTCLAVQGNTAWIAGIIHNASGPVIIDGTVSYFYVIDNGEGQNAPADVASAVRINDAAGQDQEFCQLRPLVLTPSPIAHGNVQVREH